MKENIIVMKMPRENVKKDIYLISEASKKAGVEPHVLRYWEEELQLPIKRNEAGHRYYTTEDIKRFCQIKELKNKGLQLKAIKTFISEEENSLITMSDKPAAPITITSDMEDKTYRLQMLLRGLISDAVTECNQNMVEEIKESIVKELDYQFRILNEEEERRNMEKEKREEEHYRKMDELIRKTMGKKEKKGFFKKTY